ncbi:MAG: hypothetical protein ACE5HO_21725 [bacterium]
MFKNYLIFHQAGAVGQPHRLAGGLALVIALLTVSTQAIKATLVNPDE